MKIVVENYKEIDWVKKAINEQCSTVLADAQKVFDEKQINVLNQIDEYLRGISEQLKGTKTYMGYDWEFHDGSDCYTKRSDGTYDGDVKVEFSQKIMASYNLPYLLRIRLDSNFSGESTYYFKIVDGKLISTQYKVDTEEYAIKLIKNWKKLKQAIHDGIIKDFANAQDSINKRLSKAQEIDELYDNFEV